MKLHHVGALAILRWYFVFPSSSYAQSAEDALRASDRQYWSTCGEKYGICGTVPGVPLPSHPKVRPRRVGLIKMYFLDRQTNEIIAVDADTGKEVSRHPNGLPVPNPK